MASVSSLLSEEQLECSICLDVFKDPISTPCGHNFCNKCIIDYWGTKAVYRCPLCDKPFSKRLKFSVNKVFSEMADLFRKSKQQRQTEAEPLQMIEERRVKIQEVQRSVELSKKDADREIEDSVKIFTALIRCIERSQAELTDAIAAKQKATEKEAYAFIEDLQQEITELEKRTSELRQPSHSEDHLIQNLSSINAPPRNNWTKVNVLQPSYGGTVRTAVSQLEKTLNQEMEKNLRDAELRKIQRYAVDVTLDPDTANPHLILSEDGKEVSCGKVKKNLPGNKERFSTNVCVLGKQSFSSGRFSFEVQVGGKTKWALGVARESISRNGKILLSPNDGYWTIMLRNGKEYWARGGPAVVLPVREKVQTVGVFVNYEEGLISFYDVEARVHLYSYTGCSFTEKLFPFFSPEEWDCGRNSAPLIISPVNHTG